MSARPLITHLILRVCSLYAHIERARERERERESEREKDRRTERERERGRESGERERESEREQVLWNSEFLQLIFFHSGQFLKHCCSLKTLNPKPKALNPKPYF